MKLDELVQASLGVTAASGRREKIERIAALLRRVEPPEVGAAVAFLGGELRQGRIGLGPAALREAAREGGAAGPALSLFEVDRAFQEISEVRGPGSTERRAALLRGIFARATSAERSYLVRLVLGELRQGALEGLVVEALARAAGIDASRLRRALMLAGDLPSVASAALVEGEPGLARFALRPFRPLRPMLAGSADDVADALGRLGVGALEYKLDGARVQVHKDGDRVLVFSRRLNDVTAAVPEIVEAVAALRAGALVLDGEVLALRPDGRPHAFQTTMRRFGRKLEVERLRAELPLSAFFFDCLHAGGADLVDRSSAERYAAREECVPAALRVERVVTADPAAARAFLDEALARGHEGVMAKSLAAPYESGARGAGWLKVKPARTLDLVVLAAEWGHGRRRGWLSNLHLGARDPATGGFVMVGKTFKGMTDEMLAWQTRTLLELETSRDRFTVYVRPELVVEVAFNDVQASPHYPGGVALRFARVKRYRLDKSPLEVERLPALSNRPS